jgi:hypothetical protein
LTSSHGACRAPHSRAACRRDKSSSNCRSSSDSPDSDNSSNSKQRQQQARLRQAEELARRQRQEEQVPSPYAAGEIGVAAARRSEREAYGIAVPRLPDEQIRIGRVQQLLQNRATLRELIVMKEILDQPVSLREPRRV